MFISVKEAVELTGKSQTTIYRLCKKRIRTEYIKVKDSQYLIEKDFLLETYPLEEEKDNLIDIEEVSDVKNSNTDNNIDTKTNDNEQTNVNLLADEISERVEKNYEQNIEKISLKDNFYFEKLSYWETIIGLSVSTLLIVGFISMLYFSTK